MSNERLVELIKQGRTELIEVLWNQVVLFVKKQANSYILEHAAESVEYHYQLFDDMVNQGFVEMHEAIETFDSSKGTKFTTWFSYYLHQAFQCVMFGGNTKRKQQDPLNNSKSIHETINDDRTIEDSLIDPLSDEYIDYISDRSFYKSVHGFIKKGIEVRSINGSIRTIMLKMLEKNISFSEAFRICPGTYPDIKHARNDYYTTLSRIRRWMRSGTNRKEMEMYGMNEYITLSGFDSTFKSAFIGLQLEQKVKILNVMDCRHNNIRE